MRMSMRCIHQIVRDTLTVVQKTSVLAFGQPLEQYIGSGIWSHGSTSKRLDQHSALMHTIILLSKKHISIDCFEAFNNNIK